MTNEVDGHAYDPSGKWRAAFCYIAPVSESRPATNDYIDRIAGPAKFYGFPAWYIARLESFRPE